MPKSEPVQRKVMKKRQKVYGPTGPNFTAFGKGVTALLEAHFQEKLPHDIPPHVASLIYGMGKLIRMALPFEHNSDSAVDGKAYIDIAEELDPRRRPRSKR